MNFKDIDIKRDEDFVSLKHHNEKIILYKSTFEKVRTCYRFVKVRASNEFVECVLNNMNLVGIDLDVQAKKYFIDVENEPEIERIIEKLEYHPHPNIYGLYFKSYWTFKN